MRCATMLCFMTSHCCYQSQNGWHSLPIFLNVLFRYWCSLIVFKLDNISNREDFFEDEKMGIVLSLHFQLLHESFKSTLGCNVKCIGESSVSSNLITYFPWNLKRVFRCCVFRLAFSGIGVSDDEFLDLIRKKESHQSTDEDDLDNFDQQRLERQEERIKTLQATVDAQGELLRAIADKLQIVK